MGMALSMNVKHSSKNVTNGCGIVQLIVHLLANSIIPISDLHI